MDLANLKQSFSSAASAAVTGYDAQAVENAAEKARAFIADGKTFGKKLADLIKGDASGDEKDAIKEDLGSRSALTVKDAATEELLAKKLQQIQKDVEIQIDEENHAVTISGGTLKDGTTDALRDYLAAKGTLDEAWQAPDLTVEPDVDFKKDWRGDMPDFIGMRFGRLEIQSRKIENAESMFMCTSADEIILVDQPGLENADSMFAYAQAGSISIGWIPDEIDVSFDLMRDCPSDVSVQGTLYEVSDATKADIEAKRAEALEQLPFLASFFPGVSSKEPEGETKDSDPEETVTSETDVTARRAAEASQELGVSDPEQESGMEF